MMEFLDMGGYGLYVWSSYGLSLVVLISNVIAARIRNKVVRREVAKFVSTSR